MGVATKEDLERLIAEGKRAGKDVSRLEAALTKGHYYPYPLKGIPMFGIIEIVMSDGTFRELITSGPLVEADLKLLDDSRVRPAV